MKNILPSIILFFFVLNSKAQAQRFPQGALNAAARANAINVPVKNGKGDLRRSSTQNVQSVQQVLQKIDEIRTNGTPKPLGTQWVQVGDTIIVGATPNDTLRITGPWTHYGPILVMGNGVLIFDKATVLDTGDVYVFQNGQLFADSSSLTFPQAYFYQRSLIAVQNANVQISNCSFNYSGLSHNLVIGDSAHVTMKNVYQNDWTTCGLFDHPTLLLEGCNISGEYILSDSCNATFKKADTLLLWHHFPVGANVNYNFPNGNAVNGYTFNNTVPGVSGIKWAVSADTCHNVMWAMMPENGTNVSISNSVIRAIGAWFRYGDTVTVNGLYDSSHYTNFAAPLADRTLQLLNTDVQTWSLYVFDKSHIDVSNCQVGEVGTQQKATVTQTNPFLLDGTGGYYWATDTSAVISFGATVYSYARSEKNGIFIFAYGWEPFSAPQAIGNSLLVYLQSYSPADPVPYDAATVWMDKVDGPDTSYTNSVVPVIGSAWIDWASGGSGWMDFSKYSVYYQLQGSSTWTRIVKDSMMELHHAAVANWNTNGLAAGNYNIKLTVWNNYGDSVEAIQPVTLLPNNVGVSVIDRLTALQLYPDPCSDILTVVVEKEEIVDYEVSDALGRKVLWGNTKGKKMELDVQALPEGMYLIKLVMQNASPYQGRFIKH